MMCTRALWLLFGVVAVQALYSIPKLGLDRAGAGEWSGPVAVGGAVLAVAAAWWFRHGIAGAASRLAVRMQKVPPGVWLAAIIAGGLCLRLLWMTAFPVEPRSDSATYVGLAQRLLEDGIYLDVDGNLAYWPPGYPFFLYTLYLITGVDAWVPALANALLFSLTIFAVYQLARMLGGDAAARMATLALAIWPNFVAYSGLAAKETVIAAVLPLSLLLYLQASQAGFGDSSRMALAKAVLSGALMGYAALTQPSFMLFPAVLIAAWLIQPGGGLKRQGIVPVGLFVLGMALVIAPWTYRNYTVLGQAVPVSTNGGDVFYRANNPLATGGYIKEGQRNLEGFDELERSKLGYRWGMEWIRGNPGPFLGLAWSKQILFLGDDSTGVYETLKRGAKAPGLEYLLLKAASNLFWLVIWLALLVGLLRHGIALARQPAAPVLMLSFLYLYAIDSVFESGGRHHVPLVGLIAVLAAMVVGSFQARAVQAAAGQPSSPLRPRSLSLLEQFISFAGVGAIGTVAHWSVLVFLVQWLSTDPVLASFTGAVVGALTNYVLNYRFTFRSTKRHREAMAKFLTVAGVGLALNSLIMAVCVGAGIHYLLSQVIATGLVLLWGFAGNRLWTFRESGYATRE